jgi:hypothetical protein
VLLYYVEYLLAEKPLIALDSSGGFLLPALSDLLVIGLLCSRGSFFTKKPPVAVDSQTVLVVGVVGDGTVGGDNFGGDPSIG